MAAGTPSDRAHRRGWRQRWGHLPVRWRLTAWYAVVLGATLLIFSIAVCLGLRFNLYRSLDEQVEDLTALILANVHEQGGNYRFVPRQVGNLENDEHFVRLLTADGQAVVDTSAALGGVPLDQDLVEAALGGATRLTSAQAAGQTIRVVTIPVMVDGEPRGVLQVGMSREEIDEAFQSLLVLLLAFGPLALIIATAGGYVLAGRAMAPVATITRLAAAIDADDLRTRLTLDLPDDELGRLAATFDAMLARIDEAFERQRRFTGDAAHELRTPLSLMRSRVELALWRPRSADEYRDTLHALEDDIERLGTLAGSLLTLARADAGHLALAPASFDLADTVELVREQFALEAEEAGIALRRETSSSPIVADEDLLVQVLVNLVANAVSHTPAAGVVTVGCRREGDQARLWVADTGRGIPPEHQAYVFDRFYRVDHAGSREGGGAGLGLSICRTIVTAHGGRIGLTSAPGRGTRAEAILPADQTTAET